MTQLARANAGRSTITLEGEPGAFDVRLSSRAAAAGIHEVTLFLKAGSPARPPRLRLEWFHPMVATHYRWYPGTGSDRTVVPDWRRQRMCRSKNTCDAPVYALFSQNGANALTFALSDAMNPATLAAGVVEETAEARCVVELFTEGHAPMSEYEATLRLDARGVPWYRALRDVADWWASLPGMEPMEVPEHARLPMYSSWYGFHQRLDAVALEAECREAKALGMESIIIDDGWQTDDNSRGYAWCGDWEVTGSKLPDFAAHVARVHEIGMKYLVWFSVPFVGVHSKAYARFRDKVLDPASQSGWFVLDPRFPDVREYLVSLYEGFVRRYDVDGLKLDFVDTFELTDATREATGGGRDFGSVEAAVDCLLTETMRRLRALKGDILIEFRQSYIGPLMRKYGNMFRAGDVPNDFAGNRLHTIDIRLLSGATPAHSDMVMWNAADSVESAAMQLVHALFAVPQVSVRLASVPAAHKAMVKWYLEFWRANRDVILDGDFEPSGAGFLYPVVTARSREKVLCACYGTRHARVAGAGGKRVILVNGTFDDSLILDAAEDLGTRRLRVFSCTGAPLAGRDEPLTAGLHRIEVPPAGIAILDA